MTEKQGKRKLFIAAALVFAIVNAVVILPVIFTATTFEFGQSTLTLVNVRNNRLVMAEQFGNEVIVYFTYEQSATTGEFVLHRTLIYGGTVEFNAVDELSERDRDFANILYAYLLKYRPTSTILLFAAVCWLMQIAAVSMVLHASQAWERRVSWALLNEPDRKGEPAEPSISKKAFLRIRYISGTAIILMAFVVIIVNAIY